LLMLIKMAWALLCGTGEKGDFEKADHREPVSIGKGRIRETNRITDVA